MMEYEITFRFFGALVFIGAIVGAYLGSIEPINEWWERPLATAIGALVGGIFTGFCCLIIFLLLLLGEYVLFGAWVTK